MRYGLFYSIASAFAAMTRGAVHLMNIGARSIVSGKKKLME
jgi:hypothetical protein